MHEDLTRFFAGMSDVLHGVGPADAFLGEGRPHAGTVVHTKQLEGLELYRWLVVEDRRALLLDAAPLARAACEPELWQTLTAEFIAGCPTLAWDTARYADGFVAFLAAKSERGEIESYLPELAEFTILRRRAYLASVELGLARFDATVFVRHFKHEVRALHSGCVATAPRLVPEARSCVLIIYRSCVNGLVQTIDATAARVIALLDALGQPVLAELRESVPAEQRAAALTELFNAGVIPRSDLAAPAARGSESK